MAALDDPNRLDTLGLHVTDTSKDAVLDECVRDAARRADTPIALVSVVMAHIQYFRSSFGLPPDLQASRATSRCSSFCQFVVIEEGPFIVNEASTDPRVPQELVERYNIQAYAGVPIRQGGQVIGSLCVLDTEPREFKPSVVSALVSIAERVSGRLDVLKETQDNREAEAIRPTTVALWLGSVLKKARLIEPALSQLGAHLEELTGGAEGGQSRSRESIASLFIEADDTARAMRDGALRIADALELQGALVDAGTIESFRKEARALERSVREVSPFARLFEGQGASAIGDEALARNLSVLREAPGAVRDAQAALLRIQSLGKSIESKLPKMK